MKNRIFQIGSISIFLLILFFFAILHVYLPDKQQSLIENRTLQQLPSWDYETPEEYADDLSTYVVDQFPGRSYWVTLYTRLSIFCNQWCVRNNYLVDKQWIIPKPSFISSSQIDTVSQAILEFCANHPDLTVCYAMLPYKSIALQEFLPEYIDMEPAVNNRDAIRDRLSVHDNLTFFDVSSMLLETTTIDERLTFYYKTDFHWNAKGASYGIRMLLQKMFEAGYIAADPQLLEQQYTLEEFTDKQYLGDLNRQLSYSLPQSETVSIITPTVDTSEWQYYLHPFEGEAISRDDLIAPGKDLAAVNYNDIYTSNLGYYRVENSQAITDQKILIFKDSYQNPTVDLFTLLFSQTTVIDPRYYEEAYSIDEMITAEQPDLILFLYHENNASLELASLLCD